MLFHALLRFCRWLACRRSYAMFNVFGLALGIAVFLVLTLVVRSEDGFDRWSLDAAKIYQVDSARSGLGQMRQQNISAMFAALDLLPTDYLQIESGTLEADKGRVGRRSEMLVSCRVVFVHQVT